MRGFWLSPVWLFLALALPSFCGAVIPPSLRTALPPPSAVSADTVVVPLPGMLGPYTASTVNTVPFDVGFTMNTVFEVRVHLVGEITEGTGFTSSGMVFPWPGVFDIYTTDPTGGSWDAQFPFSGSFDSEQLFTTNFGSTWDDLQDGIGQVTMVMDVTGPFGMGSIAVLPTGSISVAELIIEYTNDPLFVRGDCNDDGATDISDAIQLLARLFLPGNPVGCESACDVNDDEDLDVADAVFLLGSLFIGSATPPSPRGACGVDPTAGPVTCGAFLSCP